MCTGVRFSDAKGNMYLGEISIGRLDTGRK